MSDKLAHIMLIGETCSSSGSVVDKQKLDHLTILRFIFGVLDII